LWPATVLVMSLDRVGSAAGPDLPTFNRCREIAGPSPPRRWIGAGGVRDAADLQAAHRAGAAGWLVATALMRFAALPQAESVSPQAASGPTRAASLRIEAASVRIQAASLRR
jgi:phosphoribosylformimino-5-aminoimidazole carboxamide ribonucleotide (ProFAR) isomerase